MSAICFDRVGVFSSNNTYRTIPFRRHLAFVLAGGVASMFSASNRIFKYLTSLLGATCMIRRAGSLAKFFVQTMTAL